ncbi:MAG: DNA polymerase III subunit gamma/tau [Lysobacterales bacterium]
MSYQVLARQWRPRVFAELVGQQHVVRALSHALDSGRIHHAFLFTGTRGVGKTTIARILAKSLNCDTGTSATPCGICPTCLDIDSGRYPDLLEIDAASRTKVDDTRELLDNVVYAPSRGRFKVYLIDEVHMLSTSSFNALLKTLEEPPPHVKFLLATTDPQKLPVTVLSRCLQFNLKRLSEDEITGQLRKILVAESIAFDDDALCALARAGNGSMRDALSLLDQAIAHGGGAIDGDNVRLMLGTLSRTDVAALLKAIVADDARGLLAAIEHSATLSPDFALVLDELAALLHRLQIGKYLPEQLAEWAREVPALSELDVRLEPTTLQLLYQLAITGRRDLVLAPTPRAGFEMCLLRMLAFKPHTAGEPIASRSNDGVASALAAPMPVASPKSTEAGTCAVGGRSAAAPSEPRAVVPLVASANKQEASAVRVAPAAPIMSPQAPAFVIGSALEHSEWLRLPDALGLRGAVRELATNSVLLSHEGSVLRLGLRAQQSHLRSELLARQLQHALQPRCGDAITVKLEVVEAGTSTVSAANLHAQAVASKQADAETKIANDPIVRHLLESFDARVLPGSIHAVDPE